MTPRGRPLSDNGKVIAICLLFPLLWPVLPVVLICMGIEKLQHSYQNWKCRRAKHANASDPTTGSD
jgi:hypothetical protein